MNPHSPPAASWSFSSPFQPYVSECFVFCSCAHHSISHLTAPLPKELFAEIPVAATSLNPGGTFQLPFYLLLSSLYLGWPLSPWNTLPFVSEKPCFPPAPGSWSVSCADSPSASLWMLHFLSVRAPPIPSTLSVRLFLHTLSTVPVGQLTCSHLPCYKPVVHDALRNISIHSTELRRYLQTQI